MTYSVINLDLISIEVIFVSAASLILLIMVIWLTGIPSRTIRPRASITGTSVLETLWIAAHSQTLHEHMVEVEDPSVENLRKAGMFQVCLGDIQGTQAIASESEALLE